MADSFKLPVEVNGEEVAYTAEILRFGFTHRVNVVIDGVTVVFEPDEEGGYRACVDADVSTKINQALLEQISETLAYLLND